MNKLVTAVSLFAMIACCASNALAQSQRGAAPRYASPGQGGFVYGTPVYTDPYYGSGNGLGYSGGQLTPGAVVPGRGFLPYGSSWRPTAGSAAANFYAGGIYPNPTMYYTPPAAVTGNYFRFGQVGAGVTYWRSPTGYYYPWGGYVANSPIIIVQEGQSQSTVPPISTILTDMEKYVTEAKEKNKISEQDYTNINRRINDLRRKLSSMMRSAEGQLDPQDDTFFRRDLDTLSRDISLRVKL